MNLFEIDREITALIENGFNEECIDIDTGEIDTEKAEKFLVNLQLERDIKLDNYGKIIKNMQAEAKALEEQEKVFNKRRKTLEKKIEWFKKAVVSSLMMSGEKKFQSINVVLTTTKSTKVEVDESILDKQYMRECIEYEPDKKAIKERLSKGEEIPGAWLVTNLNLQIK